MSNQIDRIAKHVHGTDPQFLIDTIIRNKIYNTLYWKLNCFGLNVESLIDECFKLQYIGLYELNSNNNKPTAFICLLLKLLQIQPDNDIITLCIQQNILKYCRCLFMLYLRIVSSNASYIYNTLEKHYNDYRKIIIINHNNTYDIIHIDEYIDILLNNNEIYGIKLPLLMKRSILQQNNRINKRISPLQHLIDQQNDNDSNDIKTG